MDVMQKRRWRVVFFTLEIILLAVWAFSTGRIYDSSRWEYLVSNFFLGFGFILVLIRQRARIL